MPLKMWMGVAPSVDIPAQTWTLTGCFAFGFNFLREVSPSFLNVRSACWLSSIEHSSEKMTLSNVSFVDKQFRAKISLFLIFGFRINWQYFVPVHTHPIFRLVAFIVVRETRSPVSFKISRCRSGDESSSFSCRSLSIWVSMSGEHFFGRPDLARSLVVPVSLKRRITLKIPVRCIFWPSPSSFCFIAVFDSPSLWRVTILERTWIGIRGGIWEL